MMHSNPPTIHHLLEPFVTRLNKCNDNSKDISDAIRKLKASIDDQSRNLPPSVFSNLITKLFENSVELLNHDFKNKSIGVTILDCLLDINDEMFPDRRISIADQLKRVLESDKYHIESHGNILRAAAASIGHLARISSTTEIEFLQNFYAEHVTKWLSDQRSEVRRYSGGLVLKQLTINSPAFIYSKRKTCFSPLWEIVFDKNQNLRDAAAEAIESALVLLLQRESTDEFIRLGLSHIDIGINSGQIEKVHGAMVILDPLLEIVPPTLLTNNIRNSGKKFQELIWDIVKRKDSRDACIKLKVMDLIPKLAATSPAFFIEANPYTTPYNFLTYSMRHLINSIKIQNDRQLAYLALGKLFLALASSLRAAQGIINEILNLIILGFKEPFCLEALKCLSMIVKVSPLIRKSVDSTLINAMFQGGLTGELIDSLKVVVKYTPSIRSMVQVRLRTHIKTVLLNHVVNIDDASSNSRGGRFKSHSRRPTFATGSLTASASSSVGAVLARAAVSKNKQWSTNMFFGSQNIEMPTAEESVSEEELVFTLQVLATFDLLPKKKDLTESVALLHVVSDGVVKCLDDFNPAIRDAAAVTCAKVLDKVVDTIPSNTEERRILVQVLDRLMVVGVGDNSEDIRVNLFQSLSPSLDRIIADSTSVNCLTIALNDESIEVRASAISVLSRVAHFDEMHVMPLLHLILSRLMTQLNNTNDKLIRGKAMKMLHSMVRGLGTLIIPYVLQVLEPLVTLLNDASPVIVSAALSTIGDLATVSPDQVSNFISVLFPIMINAMNDQTSLTKQTAAIVTFGKMVSSLCITSDPYLSHPKLFESIVHAIQSSDPSAAELRVEATKTAGLLGAIGSEQYSKDMEGSAVGINGLDLLSQGMAVGMGVGVGDAQKKKKPYDEDDEDAEQESYELISLTMEPLSVQRYYLCVVMKALMKILKDSALATHHQTASTVAMRIVKILGLECISQLETIVDGISTRIQKSEVGSLLQGELLAHTVTLVDIVGRNIQKHTTILVKLICDYFDVHLQVCLDLIESLCTALPPQDFNIVLRDVLPTMKQAMRDEVEPIVCYDGKSDDSSPVSSGAMSSASQFRNSLAQAISHRAMEKKAFVKTGCILRSISNMSSVLGEYRRSILPTIIKVMELTGATVAIRRGCLCLLMHLALSLETPELCDYASRIIHPILRVLYSKEAALQSAALTSLSCLLCRLGPAYLPFVIPTRRSLQQLQSKDGGGSHRLSQLEEYESLVSLLLRQRHLPYEPYSCRDIAVSYDDSRRRIRVEGARVFHENFNTGMQELENAWTISSKATASDLVEWMRRLSIELIRRSPSEILRPCAGLAKAYQPLATELFNTSFLSLWEKLYDMDQNNVVTEISVIFSFEQALQNSQIPPTVRTTLLNLAEFMEIRDKRLPLDIQILAKQAEKANLFARSLRYRELEFTSPNTLPSSECIEALITINNQLGHRDAAAGILQHVRLNYHHISIQPVWLEKLNRWDDAKLAYIQESDSWKVSHPGSKPPQNDKWMSSELGVLRCLQALGEYEELSAKALQLQEAVQSAGTHIDKYDTWICEVQRLGAYAAWNLGQWQSMESFVDGQPMSKHHDAALFRDGSFYQSVLAIHKEDFSRALRLITQIRETMAGSIGSLLSESNSRVQQAMVTMQVLTEMEELVEYRKTVTKARTHLENRALLGLAVEETPAAEGAGKLPQRVYKDTKGLHGRWLSEVEAKRNALLVKWKRRWQRAPKDVYVYRQILSIRSLAIDPLEDLDSWQELVSLCRKENMLSLCKNVLKRLGAPLDVVSFPAPAATPNATAAASVTGSTLPSSLAAAVSTSEREDFMTPVIDTSSQASQNSDATSESTPPNPKVLFGMFKYQWARGERSRALSELQKLIQTLPSHSLTEDTRKLKVECLLRRAEWLRILNENSLTDWLLTDIINTVEQARNLASDQYSVWHAWAVTNYYQLRLADLKESTEDVPQDSPAPAGRATDDFLLYGSQLENNRFKKSGFKRPLSLTNLLKVNDSDEGESATTYVIEAIRGFINSIALGKDQPVANVLQDTLRLLTLWFNYGSNGNVFLILDKELDKISVDDWLSVLPQLIARLHMKQPEISWLLRKTLSRVAEHHPQALVCPISVALNTGETQQTSVAQIVLAVIKKNNSQLVEEATVVSRELLRVAISPQELWHEGLEKAAHLYIVNKDVKGMMEIFLSLHNSMGAVSSVTGRLSKERDQEAMCVIGAETLRDVSFRHEYDRDLAGALEWLEVFQLSHDVADLHQAWEIYYSISKRISVQLKSLKLLELSHVSPKLTSSRSLELAVPGTYKPSRDLIRIASFSKSVDVITSKQRPRKLTILGSDGVEYRFLLKGHEDLRQDERVMQMFGLINACLENDRSTRKRGYKIIRYTVLPLSNNSGVIGWVENCDTLYQLIKRYREERNVKVDLEQRILQRVNTDYEKLSIIQKLEVFHQLLQETSGKDLSMMLWLNSKSSDVWVDRRSNFSKSLAVMSMVGYILGLGDRHPSNIMLDRVSGRVVHIDFGDCFEVAMQRSKFPETVPFRLTRMLVNCMEASGIEGTYRSSSEKVMRILRDNRDSVMAMLEAFVYDPLISWRLLATSNTDYTRGGAGAVGVAGGVESQIGEVVRAISGLQLEEDLAADMAAGSAAASTSTGGKLREGEGTDALDKSSKFMSDESESGGAGSVSGSGTVGLPISLRAIATTAAEEKGGDKDKDKEGAKVVAGGADQQENLNSRAIEVINRIQSKLTGRDFGGGKILSVEQQVDRLIVAATAPENLSQLFMGWCPFW